MDAKTIGDVTSRIGSLWIARCNASTSPSFSSSSSSSSSSDTLAAARIGALLLQDATTNRSLHDRANALLQPLYLQAQRHHHPEHLEFLARLHGGLTTVSHHEQPSALALALAALPAHLRPGDTTNANANANVNTNTTTRSQSDLARELLHWFKHDFFRWVDTLDCTFCPAKKSTRLVGAAPPTPVETAFGGHRVELHSCNVCGGLSRFPRYNYPGKLLESRQGRCGEWANAFTLLARAAGLEARYVIDWTDHVWTELYIDSEERWVHVDCCEAAFDEPLVYEVGWGKKLSYCIAFSSEEVVDVSRRYTKDWPSMANRRTAVDEQWLKQTIECLNQARQSSLTADRREIIQRRAAHENLAGDPTRPLKEHEMEGRESGSVEWRKARGETGKQS